MRNPPGRLITVSWIVLPLVLSLLACAEPQPEKEFQARLDAALHASWAFYKTRFIQPDGRVQRPDTGDDTISEAQAYALLRAVWSRDQETFDRCYAWTEAHLSQQAIKGSRLLAWRWGRMSRGSGVCWMPTAPRTPTWITPWLCSWRTAAGLSRPGLSPPIRARPNSFFRPSWTGKPAGTPGAASG